jgi:hypothetical protein
VQRPLFILPHEAAAVYVGAEYGGKLAAPLSTSNNRDHLATV